VNNEQETVFIIDPDEGVRESLETFLGSLAIRTLSYPNAEEFLASMSGQFPDHGCLIVDATLPGLGSLAVLKRLRKEGSKLPVLVLASTLNRDIADLVLRAGAFAVIDKPLSNGQLLDRLQQLLSGAPGLLVGAPLNYKLKNGTELTIRAMRPDDGEIEQAFVTGLSARSRYLRFFSNIKQLSPHMLERFTHPRYPHDWALIATISEAGKEKEIGVARYSSTEGDSLAEFAIVVADEWQGLGVAQHLLRDLITLAENAGIKRLEGLVLSENKKLLRLVKGLGFTTERVAEDATLIRVIKKLAIAASP
jgi:FixJ family two-component response regulator